MRIFSSAIALIVVLPCLLSCLLSSASAQTISSVYTSTAAKDCRVRSAGNGVDAWPDLALLDLHMPGRRRSRLPLLASTGSARGDVAGIAEELQRLLIGRAERADHRKSAVNADAHWRHAGLVGQLLDHPQS